MICCLRHGRLVIAVLVLIAGMIGLGFYFQWPVVTQNWPFFVFLLCPLGHLLGGHSHTDHEDKHANNEKSCR